MERFERDSCVQGFHINFSCKENWTPVIGEQLKCTKEDRYTMAVIKTHPVTETVGHVPHCISTV